MVVIFLFKESDKVESGCYRWGTNSLISFIISSVIGTMTKDLLTESKVKSLKINHMRTCSIMSVTKRIDTAHAIDSLRDSVHVTIRIEAGKSCSAHCTIDTCAARC